MPSTLFSDVRAFDSSPCILLSGIINQVYLASELAPLDQVSDKQLVDLYAAKPRASKLNNGPDRYTQLNKIRDKAGSTLFNPEASPEASPVEDRVAARIMLAAHSAGRAPVAASGTPFLRKLRKLAGLESQSEQVAEGNGPALGMIPEGAASPEVFKPQTLGDSDTFRAFGSPNPIAKKAKSPSRLSSSRQWLPFLPSA